MAGRTEYKNNWQKENVDRVNLTMAKGRKEIIKAHAEAHSESVNGFINRAIQETMDRDNDVAGSSGDHTEGINAASPDRLEEKICMALPAKKERYTFAGD